MYRLIGFLFCDVNMICENLSFYILLQSDLINKDAMHLHYLKPQQFYQAPYTKYDWSVKMKLMIHSQNASTFLRGHPLSTYAKFSEKLTFLTPWYAHVCVHIRGLEMLVFWKILRMNLMDDCQANFLSVMKVNMKFDKAVKVDFLENMKIDWYAKVDFSEAWIKGNWGQSNNCSWIWSFSLSKQSGIFMWATISI